MTNHRPLVISPNAPKPGFYYHKDHDPKGDIANHAYEVLFVGNHARQNYPAGYEEIVCYRLLSAESDLPRDRVFYQSLTGFLEEAVENGQYVPRFTMITDRAVLEQLWVRKQELYGKR